MLSQAAKPAALAVASVATKTRKSNCVRVERSHLKPLCEHSDKHRPHPPGFETAQVIHERFGVGLQTNCRQGNRHQGAVDRLVMESAQELF